MPIVVQSTQSSSESPPSLSVEVVSCRKFGALAIPTPSSIKVREIVSPRPGETPPNFIGPVALLPTTDSAGQIQSLCTGKTDSNLYAAVYQLTLAADTKVTFDAKLEDGSRYPSVVLPEQFHKIHGNDYAIWKQQTPEGKTVITLAFHQPVAGTLHIDGQHLHFDSKAPPQKAPEFVPTKESSQSPKTDSAAPNAPKVVITAPNTQTPTPQVVNPPSVTPPPIPASSSPTLVPVVPPVPSTPSPVVTMPEPSVTSVAAPKLAVPTIANTGNFEKSGEGAIPPGNSKPTNLSTPESMSNPNLIDVSSYASYGEALMGETENYFKTQGFRGAKESSLKRFRGDPNNTEYFYVTLRHRSDGLFTLDPRIKISVKTGTDQQQHIMWTIHEDRRSSYNPVGGYGQEQLNRQRWVTKTDGWDVQNGILNDLENLETRVRDSWKARASAAPR